MWEEGLAVMASQTLNVIYEVGVFKPLGKVVLPEGHQIQLTIVPVAEAA
jgi:predicted DNA-binding antitoxin AbrB/MazE fold protein